MVLMIVYNFYLFLFTYGAEPFIMLRINGFLDFVHHRVFSKVENNVLETGSVSVLRWGVDTYSVGSLRKSS
jgi:hypothetical protein